MADHLRKSSRSKTIPTSTGKNSKDKNVPTKRKLEIPSDASSINETTPRTLLENVIQGHDTVHASTHKRPRLERSPIVSPRVQRYSPRRQMIIPSPGSPNESSPNRSIRASPNRSINRSSRSSLRKRATLKNFLAQGANTVGPSPRTMIEGIINEAAQETTITGTRLRSATGNDGDESASSLFLDKTRDQLRFDLSKDSFLSGYPDIQSSDRMRVLRNRNQRNKPSVNVDSFAADVKQKLQKDNIAIMNSTRKLDTTVNVREIADEIFKDVSVIEPESLSLKTKEQTAETDADVDSTHSTEKETPQIGHQKRTPGSREKLMEISGAVESSESEDEESSTTHHLVVSGSPKHGSVNIQSVPQHKHSDVDDNDDDDDDSDVDGHSSPVSERSVQQRVHSPIVGDPDKSTSDDQEDREDGEVDDAEDEDALQEDADQEAGVTGENRSEHRSVNISTEDDDGETKQDQTDSQVEIRDNQRVNDSPTEHYDEGGGLSDEDTENVPSDEYDEGTQTSSTHVTPAKLVQLKITDVLHTPGQMNLLTMMETPSMNTSLRTLTRPNVGLATKRPTTKPARVSGKKRSSSGATNKDKAPCLPASLTKSIFQHFSRRKVNKQVMEEVEAVASEFWKNTTSDLAAYAQHGHRKSLEEKDIELLMKRQGLIDDTHSLHALIENYLPLEYRQELIPIARSGNILQPKK